MRFSAFSDASHRLAEHVADGTDHLLVVSLSRLVVSFTFSASFLFLEFLDLFSVFHFLLSLLVLDDFILCLLLFFEEFSAHAFTLLSILELNCEGLVALVKSGRTGLEWVKDLRAWLVVHNVDVLGQGLLGIWLLKLHVFT